MTEQIEQSPEQIQAQNLSAETGVPLWAAYRVVRGEVNLDQLLKSMMRKEQFRKLQEQQGFDSDLAGHVVSGALPLWRAKALQEMRGSGRTRFSRDRIALMAKEKLQLSMWQFGETEWISAIVRKSRTYDVSLKLKGGQTKKVLKHNIKAVCHPRDLDLVKMATGLEKTIARQRLTASKERKDRYRPTDEQLVALKASGKPVYWVFRDGGGGDVSLEFHVFQFALTMIIFASGLV